MDKDEDQDGKKKYRPFNAIDVQKIRLEKLMNNIDKPIEIPTLPKPKNFANPPEFVRNIMGSSAGAGSGEFHVYRHIRRKEYARLNFIEAKAKQDKLDADFQKKIEENKRKMEETTAKKRAKRLKKKEKLKAKKTKKDDGDDNADHGGQDKDDNNENNDDSNDSNDSKNNSVISDSKNDNVV